MSKNLEFSNRVLILRRATGLTQEEFAKLLPCSRNYLSMVEKGRDPSDSFKRRISDLEREWQWKGSLNEPSDDFTFSQYAVLNDVVEVYHGARSALKAARQAKGMTIQELAKALGYDLGVYQNIEDGNSRMGERMIKKAAKLLSIPESDLMDGADEPPTRDVPFGSFGAVPNIGMGPGMKDKKPKFVPLLSMAQCGAMQAYTDEAYTGEGFLTYSPEYPRAFAVKLAGDSMQPRIEPGDVAVIFPSKTLRNGIIVLARLDDDHGGDVMCKVYQSTKDEVTLSSYNPAFPPLTYPRESFSWIYPVNSVTKVFA